MIITLKTGDDKLFGQSCLLMLKTEFSSARCSTKINVNSFKKWQKDFSVGMQVTAVRGHTHVPCRFSVLEVLPDADYLLSSHLVLTFTFVLIFNLCKLRL